MGRFIALNVQAKKKKGEISLIEEIESSKEILRENQLDEEDFVFCDQCGKKIF